MKKRARLTLLSGILILIVILVINQFSGQSDNSTLDVVQNEEESMEMSESTGEEENYNLFDDQTFMTTEHLDNRLEALSSNIVDRLQKGGPPPDGIPSIDQPSFVDLAEADQWLEENEPVIWVEVNGKARAYPLQILMWHEIVNDTINDVPISITFCPLCNSSFSFKRDVGDHLLDFGTTGYLYEGAMLMYDRQTQSLWAHFGGEALGGPLKGERLELVPSSIVAWREFKETYPDGLVLSKDTSFERNYGQNPYVGYDQADEPPFLFSGEIDGSFAPKERIVAVEVADQAKSYLTETLSEKGVINDSELAEDIVLFFKEGTASGLDDASIASGKEVGSSNVFFSEVDGETLEFYKDGESFKDSQTESTWNFFGEATSGPLEGEKLTPVPFKLDTFWFAWAAYEPDTLLYVAE
ncbi:DUF3179 domain-containing protein [Salipaludibacillus daqingensis]|uniref:DUF3179 domain-containing protein n=1 Tax=Salipaludibacillus daqingensis TaxID=3041001 RepID=UPI002473FC92|nr:DUF3179 domain-containing protein [Salipaludibacillus daqingensis]